MWRKLPRKLRNTLNRTDVGSGTTSTWYFFHCQLHSCQWNFQSVFFVLTSGTSSLSSSLVNTPCHSDTGVFCRSQFILQLTDTRRFSPVTTSITLRSKISSSTPHTSQSLTSITTGSQALLLRKTDLTICHVQLQSHQYIRRFESRSEVSTLETEA